MNKWPPKMELDKSVGFNKIEMHLIRYMQINNFKYEEIDYILAMLNIFCFLNKPKLEEND